MEEENGAIAAERQQLLSSGEDLGEPAHASAARSACPRQSRLGGQVWNPPVACLQGSPPLSQAFVYSCTVGLSGLWKNLH